MSHENYIKEHIFSIPELIENHLDETYERVKSELPEEKLRKIRKIVMTGCGYSYAAGLNAKYIFEKIARVSTEIPYSIDASRHLELSVLPAKAETLFIGVSNSGIVARIAECVQRFSDMGAMTVVFTGNRDSTCARRAEYIIDVSCPELRYSLPLRGYVMTLMTCFSIAWRIAIVKKLASESDRIKFFTEIKTATYRLEDMLPDIEQRINRFADKVIEAKIYEFVGSGIGFASAWVGKQQMAGQTGKPGLDCSAEDWLHSNFFLNEPEQIGTLLFMPSNSPALSRIKEVRHYMTYIKRPLCVITDMSEVKEDSIILPYGENELLNPIFDIAPVSLFAGRVCQMIGEEYSRGFRNNWNFSRDGQATEFSEIKIVK